MPCVDVVLNHFNAGAAELWHRDAFKEVPSYVVLRILHVDEPMWLPDAVVTTSNVAVMASGEHDGRGIVMAVSACAVPLLSGRLAPTIMAMLAAGTERCCPVGREPDAIWHGWGCKELVGSATPSGVGDEVLEVGGVTNPSGV